MKDAFHVARTGRPGPVLVDIAKDAQEAELDFAYPDEVDLPGWRPPTKVNERQIREAAKAIAESRSSRSSTRAAASLNADASAELLELVEAARPAGRRDADGQGLPARLAPARTTALPACTARSTATGRSTSAT